MKTLSTAQLSDYLSVTKRTIQRRAIRESWPYEIEIGLGGERRLYAFESLPPSVRQSIVSHIVSKHEQQGLAFKPSGESGRLDSVFDMKDTPFITLEKFDSENWVTQHSFAHHVDVAELNKEYVRQGLLVMAKLYVVHFSIGKIKGFDRFCELYNQQALAIDQGIYQLVRHISRISLLRWEKQLAKGQISLSDKSTHQSEGFEHDIVEMISEVLLVSPNIGARRLRQHFLTLFKDRKLPSERQFALWLMQYQTDS